MGGLSPPQIVAMATEAAADGNTTLSSQSSQVGFYVGQMTIGDLNAAFFQNELTQKVICNYFADPSMRNAARKSVTGSMLRALFQAHLHY